MTMMKTQSPRTLLFAALVTLAGACGTESSGVSLQIAAVSSTDLAGEIAAVDSVGTRYAFTAARAFLRDIELDIPDGLTCADLEGELVGATCSQDKVRIPGPFVIDLMTGRASPSLADVRIPAGTYKRIDFRLDDGRPGLAGIAEGDDLDDRSLVARATFLHEGKTKTLLLSLKFNEDVRFDDPAGITVGAEGETLLAKLDVGRWFDGVSLTRCLDDGDLRGVDGVVVVDDSIGGGCSDVEEQLKTNIKTHADLDKR